MGLNKRINKAIDETNMAIDNKIDDTNQAIDDGIDEVNKDIEHTAHEVSQAVSFGRVADALLEDDNQRKNPFNDIDHEKAAAQMEEEEEARESSFEQAVKEQNMRLQREADRRGMRQNEANRDRGLER